MLSYELFNSGAGNPIPGLLIPPWWSAGFFEKRDVGF